MDDRILELKQKYNHYIYRYDDKIIPTCLIDAVLSNSRHKGLTSHPNQYDEEIEKDIYDIIDLIPESLYSRDGGLRVRWKMTALHLACFNPNIPIKLIKYMIDKGADINQTYDLCGNDITVIQDLEKHVDTISQERFKKLKTLALQSMIKKNLIFKISKGILHFHINDHKFNDYIIEYQYNDFLEDLNKNEILNHLK